MNSPERLVTIYSSNGFDDMLCILRGVKNWWLRLCCMCLIIAEVAWTACRPVLYSHYIRGYIIAVNTVPKYMVYCDLRCVVES